MKVSLPTKNRVAIESIDGVMVDVPITRTPLGSKYTGIPDTVTGGPPGRSVLRATSKIPEGPTAVMGCPATVASAEAVVRGIVLPATTIPAAPVDTGVLVILITDWPELVVWLPIGELFELELDDPADADVEIDVRGPEGSIKPVRLGTVLIRVDVILEGELAVVIEGTGSGVELGNAGVVIVLWGSVIGVSPPATGVRAEGGSRGPVAPLTGTHVDQADCSATTFDGIASIGRQGSQTPTTPSEAVAIPGIAVQSVSH